MNNTTFLATLCQLELLNQQGLISDKQFAKAVKKLRKRYNHEQEN